MPVQAAGFPFPIDGISCVRYGNTSSLHGRGRYASPDWEKPLAKDGYFLIDISLLCKTKPIKEIWMLNVIIPLCEALIKSKKKSGQEAGLTKSESCVIIVRQSEVQVQKHSSKRLSEMCHYEGISSLVHL